jgi:hypothetical protein
MSVLLSPFSGTSTRRPERIELDLGWWTQPPWEGRSIYTQRSIVEDIEQAAQDLIVQHVDLEEPLSQTRHQRPGGMPSDVVVVWWAQSPWKSRLIYNQTMILEHTEKPGLDVALQYAGAFEPLSQTRPPRRSTMT